MLNNPAKIAWEKDYDGVSQYPVCPNCHEYAYERDKCVFCGQLFVTKDEKMDEYCRVTKAEKDGYTAVQTFNNHIQVYDAEGRFVSHASCTKKMTEEELARYLDLILKLNLRTKGMPDELFEEDEDG